MAITTTAQGTTVTGDDTAVFGYLALRGALKLQALGLSRRGTSPLTLVKQRTGLKAKDAKSMLPLYEEWLRTHGMLPR